jgi:hypothetical protein
MLCPAAAKRDHPFEAQFCEPGIFAVVPKQLLPANGTANVKSRPPELTGDALR